MNLYYIYLAIVSTGMMMVTAETSPICPIGTYSSTGASFCTPCCTPSSCPTIGSTYDASIMSPGYYCSNGSTTICPIGSYCIGGVNNSHILCDHPTACPIIGLSALPMCYWNVSTIGGTGIRGFSNGLPSLFSYPLGIAYQSGSVFVSDYGNFQVRTISSNGTVNTFVGGGIDGVTSGYANGAGTNALFGTPVNLDFHPNGTAFICEQNSNLIRAISPSGFVTTVSTGPFSWPSDLVWSDFFQSLFIADRQCSRIQMLTMPSNVLSIFVGGNSSGCTSGHIDGTGTAALFRDNYGISTDIHGNLYSADMRNHKIRKISPSKIVTTIAGGGASGFLNGVVNGVGTAALFNDPRNVYAFSSTLYVSDTGNHLIRSISMATFVVTTLAGSIMGHRDGPSSLALFENPAGLKMSPIGLLVVEMSNYVRKLSCVPCPASYYCSSGSPVLCPTGSYCPFGSSNPILCPAGTYSSAGAVSCTSCSCSDGCPTGSTSDCVPSFSSLKSVSTTSSNLPSAPTPSSIYSSLMSTTAAPTVTVHTPSATHSLTITAAPTVSVTTPTATRSLLSSRSSRTTFSFSSCGTSTPTRTPTPTPSQTQTPTQTPSTTPFPIPYIGLMPISAGGPVGMPWGVNMCNPDSNGGFYQLPNYNVNDGVGMTISSSPALSSTCCVSTASRMCTFEVRRSAGARTNM